MPEAVIGTFRNQVIAIERPRVRTYYFLKWHADSARWFPHDDISSQDRLVFKRTRVHGVGGSCYISISLRAGRQRRINLKNSFGDYLLHVKQSDNSTQNIPILKAMRSSSIPNSYKKSYLLRGEDPAGADAPMMTDVSLWIDAAPPAPVPEQPAPAPVPEQPAPAPVPEQPAPAPVPQPQQLPEAEQRQGQRGVIYRVTLKPIPQRIAWILAEDACKKGETCSITMEEITPLTSSVTTCYHFFNSEAIETWLQSKPMRECPVCKRTCYATKACDEIIDLS
jgi:Zinc-finger of the MIZ type in Nse subunit